MKGNPEIDHLHQVITHYVAREVGLQADIDEKTNTITRLKNTLTSSKGEWERSQTSLTEDLAEKNRQIDFLIQQLDRLRSGKTTPTRDLHEQIQSLHAELSDRDKTIRDLNHKAQILESGDNAKLIEKYEQQLQQIQLQNKNQEYCLKDTTDSLEGLGHMLQNSQDKLSDTTSALTQAKRHIDLLTSELQQTKISLLNSERRVVTANKLSDTLQEKVHAITDKLSLQINLNQTLNNTITKLREEITLEAEANTNLSNRLDSLEKCSTNNLNLNQSSQQIMSDLTRDIKSLQTDKQKLLHSISKLSNRITPPTPSTHPMAKLQNLPIPFSSTSHSAHPSSTKSRRQSSSLSIPSLIDDNGLISSDDDDTQDDDDNANRLRQDGPSQYDHIILQNQHNPTDVYAGHHLAGLTSNLRVLQPEELYREDIQGALALSKWLRSIEVVTPDPTCRSRIALAKLDSEILERLSGTEGDIHSLSYDQLKLRLYRFVTPSTFDVALTKLFQMEYFGHEHPATFYSMLVGYLRTMGSTFPGANIPRLGKVIQQCLLAGLTRSYRALLNTHLNNSQTIDDFLSTFTRIYNETPHHALFREKPIDNVNISYTHPYPEARWPFRGPSPGYHHHHHHLPHSQR